MYQELELTESFVKQAAEFLSLSNVFQNPRKNKTTTERKNSIGIFLSANNYNLSTDIGQI